MTRDRHDLPAADDVANERFLVSRRRQQGRGEDDVEERAGNAEASHLLLYDGELDGAELLATRARRQHEPEVAHLGEAPPLGGIVPVLGVLHHVPTLLERELAREKIARRAPQERLIVGKRELHRVSCGRFSTRLEMMLRWISEDPE